LTDMYEVMLKIISAYRHEFLNHLQVVSGMAQLNKKDRLLGYVRKASDEVQLFGRLAACGDPRLFLLLYELFLHDPEIDAVFEIRGQVDQLAPGTLEAVALKLTDFCESLRRLGPCQVVITLIGDGKPYLEVQIVGDVDTGWMWPALETRDCDNLFFEIDKPGNKITLLLDKSEPAEER
jgi:hypothetical protein